MELCCKKLRKIFVMIIAYVRSEQISVYVGIIVATTTIIILYLY
jgi:hypothetical protein